MRRLKTAEVSEVREQMLTNNSKRCGLCQLSCSPAEAVLDHDHSTGAIRDTLHRGCNSLLGKLENNFKRYGVKNLAAFLHGAVPYLQKHEENKTGLLHPSHKSEDEKRLARNAKARKARALKKARV